MCFCFEGGGVIVLVLVVERRGAFFLEGFGSSGVRVNVRRIGEFLFFIFFIVGV